MTKKNHPDGMAFDPTVTSIGSAENDVEGTAVEAEGTLSPIAQHCNGIVSALNELEHVPDAVQHTIAVYIADILATFTETERKARTARENVSQLKSNLRRAKEEIAKLRKAKFGQSSERSTDGDLDNCDEFCSGDDTLDDLDFEDDEETKEKIKGRRVRKVPPTIETKEIDHFPHNRTCFTCGCEMHVIGVESTSRLKIIAEHVVRIKENYHRLACNHGVCKDNKPVAAKSQHYIMKGRTLDPSFLIEAACQKFIEHSTNFRMERRLHFQDLNVSRQTLGRNIEHLADCLVPLHEATLDTVQQGSVAFMDETPLRIQSTTSGRGKCETGYLWAFSRDESGWNPEARPVVHFHYAPTRSGSVAKELVANSSVEILQTDGYAGYQKLFDAAGANDSLKRAGCLTHAQRKFVEAETASSSPLARRVISKLKKLYKIEEDGP